MVPPSFMTGLKPEQSLKDGSKLELKVQVKGDPDPMVTWTKDGKPLSSSEIMEVKYKNGFASVVINEVFPEDGGKYTCKATNSKGSVETSSKVAIIPMEKKTNGVNGSASSGPLAPRVLKHVKSAAVKDGDPVTLTCTLGEWRDMFEDSIMMISFTSENDDRFIYRSYPDLIKLE